MGFCGHWGSLSSLFLTNGQNIWLRRLYRVQRGFPLIPSVLELTYLENRGMAFGMFQGKQVIFLLVLYGVFLILLIYAYRRIPKTLYYLPLIITGAVLGQERLGNLIDRFF